MSEEFNIGGQGIDTPYERERINYRPSITYTPPVIDSSYGSSVDTASQESLEEIGDTSIMSLWEDVVDVIQKVDSVESNLSEKLKTFKAPVSSFYQEAIQKAAEELGYQGITDNIPFSLYRETFSLPPSPETALIQDAFEEYASDVNGQLNAELYADIAEIKNDWKDMLEFIKKGLFAQLVSIDEVPSDLSTSDSALEVIQEKEALMRDQYAQVLKVRKLNEQIFMQLSTVEYGSDRYFQSVKDLDDIKREQVNLEKKLFTKTEVVDLIERKASDTDDNVELIENSIDFDPYKEEKYEVLYGLLKQFNSKESMQRGIRKMQAILKLSVDRRKIDTNDVKDNLRGIAGSKTKRRINKTLVNGIHLKNEVFGEVYDIMNHLDGVPDNENFDVMANYLSEGIAHAEELYKAQASDFYKIHAMDSQLRSDKLVGLIEKDTARSTYKLMDKVIAYSNDVNQTWPSDAELSTWLSEFMQHGEIS